MTTKHVLSPKAVLPCAVAVLLSLVWDVRAAEREVRPNFIVILIDDLGWAVENWF